MTVSRIAKHSHIRTFQTRLISDYRFIKYPLTTSVLKRLNSSCLQEDQRLQHFRNHLTVVCISLTRKLEYFLFSFNFVIVRVSMEPARTGYSKWRAQSVEMSHEASRKSSSVHLPTDIYIPLSIVLLCSFLNAVHTGRAFFLLELSLPYLYCKSRKLLFLGIVS